MSCYGCIFKSEYQDMGASCDVCKLQDYLPDAIKACDNSENCPHRVTLQEAKKKLLSSDVVEVVRCKDCAHYHEMKGFDYKGRKAHHCVWHSALRGENDYCSDGIRREENER